MESGYYGRLLEKGFIKEEDQEPQVTPFAFYFDAFRELCSCRQSGMEAGPIPFTAIVQYSTIYQVEDFEGFLRVIRLMDDCVLEDVRNKQSSASKKPVRGGNGR